MRAVPSRAPIEAGPKANREHRIDAALLQREQTRDDPSIPFRGALPHFGQKNWLFFIDLTSTMALASNMRMTARPSFAMDV